ncbi:MAG: sigma-54-dependent Fis family transcriptional regulator, partial [Planctomycetes bacterium]|nr:sigma-54-dependent Fis family transcriptional regulator [Planctomycetota bacterium]
ARQIDVRVIAATNRKLEDEIRQGQFREDLYYRLRVVHIHVPELKERREDVPLLIDHFIAEANRTMGRQVKGIDDAARQRLVNCDWPGNVRQLRNAINNMVVMSSGDELHLEDVPPELRGETSRGQALVAVDSLDGLSLSKVEEYMIRHYLERFEGNRARVAGALGISERTLYRKLKEYDLN